MDQIHNDHSHIAFQRAWRMTDELWYMLGQCDAIVKAISNTPISPDYRTRLHSLALVKGAQATTAIEGNTLTLEEIGKIQEGANLPPSRDYLQKEVENILKAFNTILKDTILEKKTTLITPDLIKDFHRMVGDNLGEAFQAQPGKFRRNNVIVANYRAPAFESVPALIDRLCGWLNLEFHFREGQAFHETILQAVVTHVYIAWIHPFGDGNGRIARLLEFYLLMRAGVPDIASHILSNFYNLTRSEYYRQLASATDKKDLSDFLFYAFRGFRDGLVEVLEIIRENQLMITWRNYIYGIFEERIKSGSEGKTAKRRRNLILRIPHEKSLSLQEILELHPTIFQAYKGTADRTFLRDLNELVKLDVLEKKEGGYRAKIEILGGLMARASGR